MDESNNKRKRTTTSNTNDNLHITSLPDGLLVGISSYLAKPSSALFAIAINTQSVETSKAILSANWNVLDFSDIEKSLAAKLSDDDINKILKSINAVNNLQILKLAGCVNITGSGLNVLRSSTTIEQIDMSLVGMHEVPLIEPEPLLSKDIVIPILDNIISRGRGSRLKQLELPKKWRNAESIEMTQFFERYNNYLRNQRYCCSICDRVCREIQGGDQWIYLEGDPGYGTQCYTCSQCVQHVCIKCFDDENSNWCRKCEKEYCKNCVLMNRCENCEDRICCNKCEEMKTCEEEGCETIFCGACSERKTCHICDRMRCGICITRYDCDRSDCNRSICIECAQSKEEGGECQGCGMEYCSSDCRHHIQESRKAHLVCLDCS